MQKSSILLSTRHQPSGLNTTFDGANLSFEEYLATTHAMLHKAHSRLNHADIDVRVANNMPFMRVPAQRDGKQHPYRRGILLTHGLTDSPYFMRHLAEFFVDQGFLVIAILLPGHGTQPGDLLNVRWQAWAEAVKYGADKIAEQADELYLGGLSTGATLSLYQSLRDARVRGLFLFSPALGITHRAAYAGLHKLYSQFLPAAKWVTLQPDSDTCKYESFPKNGALQMRGLIRALPAQQNENKLPIFTAASADDTTVKISDTLTFMARATHPCSTLLLYATNRAAIPNDCPAQKLHWVNSALPEQNILSASHLSLVLPADDAHYGRHGDYANCAHYYPHDMTRYAACRLATPDVAQGEITPKNLRAGVLRRLMYNPNYPAMLDALRQFIRSLP